MVLILALLLAAQAADPPPRTFRSQGVELRLYSDAGKLVPVLAVDPAIEATDAIIELFYRQRIETKEGKPLDLLRRVVCPVVPGAAGACDPPVPLRPEHITFVRIKILRAVKTVEIRESK